MTKGNRFIVLITLITVIIMMFPFNVFATNTYQTWSGVYPQSPVGTELESYPYQFICTRTSDGAVFLCYSAYQYYTSGGEVKIVGLGSYQYFVLSGETWGSQGSTTGLTISGKVFNKANCDIYSDESLITKTFNQTEFVFFENYYIKDKGDLFTTVNYNTILEIEKKFEQNFKVQFFLTTNERENFTVSRFGDIITYGNTKSPTGNGAFVIDIDHNTTDNSYKILVTMSGLSCLQEPALSITNSFKKFMKISDDVNIDNIEKALNDIYNKFGLQDSYELNKFGSYDMFGGTENYTLESDKLNVLEGNTDYQFSQDESVLLLFDNNPSVSPTPRPTTEPTPVPTSTPEIGSGGYNPPGDDAKGFFSGLWNLLGEILKLIFAFLGSIFKAITFKDTLHGTNGGSGDFFNNSMIQGILFLKNYNLSQTETTIEPLGINLNFTIWTIFEWVFSFSLTLILFKIAKKSITTDNGWN